MKIFTAVLTTSACMTPVILLLLALRPLLRKKLNPHTRYYAWLLVLVGLMIPFGLSPARKAVITVELPESRALVVPVQAAGGQVGGSRIVGEREAAARAFMADYEVQTYRTTLQEAMAQTAPSALPIAFQWPDPVTLMMLLWLGGMAAFYSLQFIRQGRFRRMVRRWQTPPAPAQLEAAAQEAERLGIRRLPRLERCACVSSPMLVGLFRPLLLVPETELSQEEFHFILRHELTHCRKGDLWYKAFMLLALGIHWFNPAVLIMCRAMASDCEISCDQSVLRAAHMPERRQYGETILGVIRRQKQQPVALSTHFYEGKGGIKKRFAAMLDLRAKPKGYVLLALCLVMTLMAGNVLALSPYIKDETGLTYDANWRERVYPQAFPQMTQLAPNLIQSGDSAYRSMPVAANRLLTLSEAERLYDLYYLYDGEGLRASEPVEVGPLGDRFTLAMPLADYIACMERDELGATYQLRTDCLGKLPFLQFPGYEMGDEELLQLIELEDALLLLEPFTYRVDPQWAQTNPDPESNRSPTRREQLRRIQLRRLYLEDATLRPQKALTNVPGDGLYIIGYNGGGETVYHYPQGREMTDEELLEILHPGMQNQLSRQAVQQNEIKDLAETAELNGISYTALGEGMVTQDQALTLAQGYLESPMPEEKFSVSCVYDPTTARWAVAFEERVPNGAAYHAYQVILEAHTGRLEQMSHNDLSFSSHVFLEYTGSPLIGPLLPANNYFARGDGREEAWQETVIHLFEAHPLYESSVISAEPSRYFTGDRVAFTLTYADGNLARVNLDPLTGTLCDYTFYTPETLQEAYWHEWETEAPVNE